jgi:LysM repeat protein
VTDRPRTRFRDWAAPPPWAASEAAGGRERTAEDADGLGSPPERAEGAGLARSRWLADDRSATEAGGDTAGGATGDRAADGAADDLGGAPVWRPAAPPFLAGRAGGGPESRSDGSGETSPKLAGLVAPSRPAGSPTRRDPRPMAGQRKATRRPARDDDAPSWERPRRFEAYPTLKTRVGLPTMPRLALGVIALAVAAVLLFMIPALFFGSGDQAATATPSPTVAPSVSAAPSPSAAPTPVTYTVAAGDNLGKIAKRFGITQQQILDVNPQIMDRNKIAIGQVIIIPGAAASEVIDSGPTDTSSPSGAGASPSGAGASPSGAAAP